MCGTQASLATNMMMIPERFDRPSLKIHPPNLNLLTSEALPWSSQ